MSGLVDYCLNKTHDKKKIICSILSTKDNYDDEEEEDCETTISNCPLKKIISYKVTVQHFKPKDVQYLGYM